MAQEDSFIEPDIFHKSHHVLGHVCVRHSGRVRTVAMVTGVNGDYGSTQSGEIV